MLVKPSLWVLIPFLSKRCLVILLLAWGWAAGLIVSTQAVMAQVTQSRVRFEHIGVDDGLSQGDILALHQDRQGFIWIGTNDGLNRYDGYDFTIFKHDPEDPNSISDTTIDDILEARDGTLWFSTYLGLSRFDPDTQTFTNFRHDPQDPNTPGYITLKALYEDRAGHIWIGTLSNILDRFDPQTETFTHFTLPLPDAYASGMPLDEISGIVEDDGGILWVETDVGLYRFDPHREVFTHYPFESVELEARSVGALYADEVGGLWVGNWGLYRFDRTTGEATRFLPDPTNPVPDPATPTNAVKAIYPDPSGRLWVGTFSGGLYLFDPTTGGFEHFAHDPEMAYSLKSNSIMSLLIDRSGVLWVGLRRKGLHRYRLGTERVTFLQGEPWDAASGRGLYEDAVGRRWLGLAQGTFVQLDTAHAVVRQYQLPGNLGDAATISTFYVSPSDPDVLWIGDRNTGLYRLHLPSGRYTNYQYDPEDPRSLSDNQVTVCLESPSAPGTFWVGTVGGLNRFDPTAGTFTRYLPDLEDPTSIGGAAIRDLEEDAAGKLWVAIDGFGLDHFDPATGHSTHYRHDPEDPTTISNDGPQFIHASRSDPGILWIATWSGGLNRFDPTTGRFTRFTRQNSDLIDNHIEVILEEDDGYLWLGTAGGIVRMDPRTATFKHFGVGTGMQGKYIHMAVQSRTGELLFRGATGVDVFFPDQLVENHDPPAVVLTDFKLAGESIRPRADSFLPVHISATDRIELRHDQHDISFDFVALHFTNPAGNQYHYQLEGYDADWYTTRTQRSATYTNLDPGTYTFRVKAANSDGYWNEEGASVEVTILPPWWRTTWAYLVYGLLFVAGVFAIDRIQRRRLIAQEREKARARELAQAREIEKAHIDLQQAHAHLKATQDQLVQAEKMASLGQLTAGIAHEIKNPLNFVNNFAQLCTELADELADELTASSDKPVAEIEGDLKEIVAHLKINAAKIEEHGKRADGIVQSMLMHSRSTAGERRATDVNALLDEYVNLAYHGMRAQVADFNVTLDCAYDEAVGAVEMVPQEIGQVLINLLNNAFYAVHEKADAETGYEPIVQVSTRRNGDTVEVRIADNGPGINKDFREKIFEPFYTTKPTGSGTGLGLSLSYDIVTKGHGGQLAVASEPGDGATFILTLPVSTP